MLPVCLAVFRVVDWEVLMPRCVVGVWPTIDLLLPMLTYRVRLKGVVMRPYVSNVGSTPFFSTAFSTTFWNPTPN